MTITCDLETECHVTVTVYVTFVISACICPTEMIVLLRKVFGSGHSFQTIANCVIFKLDLETESHVSVDVTFCLVRLLKHVEYDGTLRFKVTRDGHASGNSQNKFLDLKT